MADRSSGMHFDNDPWKISSLISAILELFMSILLLSSVVVAFLTSQLVRILGLDPPCSYIGCCHHAFHSAENSVPPGTNNISGKKTSVDSACKEVMPQMGINSSKGEYFNGDCVSADDQHEKNEEHENEQRMMADHQYQSDQWSDETTVHSDGKMAKRKTSEAMLRLVSADLQGEHVKGNSKLSSEAYMVNLPHHSCTLPSVLSDLDNGSSYGQSISFDGVKDQSSPPTSVDSATRGGFLLTDNQQERGVTYVDIDEGNDINALKEALEAERSTSAALEAELEKERNAAAIAASEAMAMISRLQEEKAAMQIEVSQLQRMSEEKADYDQQAISLMEEILFKREKEKFVLEKEVELYRERLRAEKVLKRRASRLAKVVIAKPTEFPLALTEFEDTGLAEEVNQQNAAMGARIFEGDRVEDLEQQASRRLRGIIGSPNLFFPIKRDNGQTESSHEGLSELEKHAFSINDNTHLILDRLSAIEDELHELQGAERDKEGGMDIVTENEHVQNKALVEGSLKVLLNRRLFFSDEAHIDKDWIAEHTPSVDDPWEQHEWNSQSSEEVHQLSVRMDALEADRELLRKALDSIKLKNSEISLLEEIVQHLRCFHASRSIQKGFGDFSLDATFPIKQVAPAFKKRRYSGADQHEGGL